MHGTTRKLLTFLHVAVSVSILGTDLVLITLALAGYGLPPEAVYPAAELVGERVLWPLAIASAGSGVAVALIGPYRLFRFWWVSIKLAITLLLVGLLTFVLLPALSAASQAATGPVAISASRQLMLTIAPIVTSALLLTNIALAVFKPKWQLPRAAKSTRSEVAA